MSQVVGETASVVDALAVFPGWVIELLQVSQSDLVQMLRAGWLRRPGKLAADINYQVSSQAREGTFSRH